MRPEENALLHTVKIRNVIRPDNSLRRRDTLPGLTGAAVLISAVALVGCRTEPRGPSSSALPPPPPAFVLRSAPVPPGPGIHVLREIALRAPFRYRVEDSPDTLTRVAGPEGSSRTTVRRYYLQRHEIDSRARDTVDVVLEHLVELSSGIASAGRWMVISGGNVQAAGGTLPERGGTEAALRVFHTEIRTVAVENGRRLIAVRYAELNSGEGRERYTVLGHGANGALQEYGGPVWLLHDGDLPGSLRAGQVFYANLRHGCIRIPVPLTFEPRTARFVAEVSDDGLLPASGEATFTGGETGSGQLRLYAGYRQGSSTIQASIAVPSPITIKRAYVPWLASPGGPSRRRGHDWVFITVGLLEGWVPDSLYRHTGLLQCGEE